MTARGGQPSHNDPPRPGAVDRPCSRWRWARVAIGLTEFVPVGAPLIAVVTARMRRNLLVIALLAPRP